MKHGGVWGRLALLVGVAALSAGCFSTKYVDRTLGLGGRAPAVLPSAAQVPVCGYDVLVKGPEDDKDLRKGELLAVRGEELLVLNREGQVSTYPFVGVDGVKVKVVPGISKPVYGFWWGAGLASMASHGVWIMYTGPAWLLVGGATLATAAADRNLKVEATELARLSTFARYPGGLPAALDPTTLRVCPEGLSPSAPPAAPVP